MFPHVPPENTTGISSAKMQKTFSTDGAIRNEVTL